MVSSASADGVVHAVLFYSPSCGHCHLVITETLPPLFEQYGEQLVVVGVDVSQSAGQQLFRAALQFFGLASGGVPMLVVGETYLLGSVDIPGKFPGLIEDYLAQGGVDWPEIPGFAEALAAPSPTTAISTSTLAAQPSETADEATLSVSAPTDTPEITPTSGLIITGEEIDDSGPKFSRDLLGNSLAVIVLIGMILSVIGAAIHIFVKPIDKKFNVTLKSSWRLLFPLLCLLGLGVAGYLAFVETAQVEAVCGPVGDCNAVQQSSYALLFGFLPIGVLGVTGYLLILLSWILGRLANQRLTDLSSLAILGMTTFGVLFSIYLTFLEPFVIGATCAWCLSSAIIMTVLFWLSLAPGKQGWLNVMK